MENDSEAILFAAHNIYHLREGWIFKGLSAVADAEAKGERCNVFLGPDAPLLFGIGPGMVQAIRFWMQAAGLTSEDRQHGRSTLVRLTDFGRIVWEMDPYLDRLGTIWLLHFHLVSSRQWTPTWYWFFNHYTPGALFDEETCLESLRYWVIKAYPETVVAHRSLKKDLACLFRMYAAQKDSLLPEHATLSPLARLHLLVKPEHAQGQGRHYRILPSDPDHIHPFLFLYILVVQQQRQRVDSIHVRLFDALYEPGNAGRTLVLTQTAFIEMLVLVRLYAPEWEVQLLRSTEPPLLVLPSCSPMAIIKRYYQEGV